MPLAYQRFSFKQRLQADTWQAVATVQSGEVQQRGKQVHKVDQRIASRAQGRINDLNIHIEGKTVVLSGHCATYYSKQLAQHAAQGIMDNEHLENKIQVIVPR